MNHVSEILQLPQRLDDDRLPPAVPCVGFVPHSAGFRGAGDEYGCPDFQRLLELRHSHPAWFQHIIQSWLYFGLLREFFPEVFDIDDFRSGPPGEETVSSLKLVEYCSLPQMRSELRHKELHDCLELAISWIDEIDGAPLEPLVDMEPVLIDTDGPTRSGTHTRTQLIIASIKVLIDTLSDYLQLSCALQCMSLPKAAPSLAKHLDYILTNLFFPGDFYVRDDPRDRDLNNDGLLPLYQLSRRQATSTIRPTPANFLLDMLQQQGWCPRQVARIRNELDSTCVYLLLALEHVPRISHGTHSACSERECKHDVDAGIEGPTHTSGCTGSDCQLVSVPVSELVDIYSNESMDVPVISCVRGQPISVQRSGEQNYYAISHVWSEGLGNGSSSAIFDCRLREIIELVEADPQAHPGQSPQSPIRFWLDTLCIPPRSHDSSVNDAKKRAIQSMDWVFAAAHCVLIRDLTLQDPALNFFALNPLAQTTYLYNMRWLGRCWTLAEAVAAWRLNVTVSGVSRTLSDLVGDIARNIASDFPRGFYGTNGGLTPSQGTVALRRNILQSVCARFLSPFNVFLGAKEGNQDIVATWNALLQRSTKEKSDIPGILAVANAISPREVVEYSRHDTVASMKCVLNAFHHLPAAFLFQDGPKLDEPHNRWVPAGPPYWGDLLLSDPSGPRSRADEASLTSLSGSTVHTYTEGTVVGPLKCSPTSPVYLFRQSPPQAEFYLDLSPPERPGTQLVLVKVNDSFSDGMTGRTWCLVPSSPLSGRSASFGRNSSSSAFCATISRATRTRSRILVTWKSLASVRPVRPDQQDACLPKLVPEMLHTTSVYISCDMTSWPTPRPLRHTSSVRQERASIRYHGQLTTLAFLGTGLTLIFSTVSYLNSPHPINAFMSLFFFVLLILGAFKYAKSYRSSTPEIESRTRTHEDWKNIFMPRHRPRKESVQQRYKNWLRKSPHLLRYPYFERLIFTIELGLCAGAIVPATFLAIHYGSQRWFLAPMICACLNLIVAPLVLAHCIMNRVSSIYIPFGSAGLVGICLTLTLTPLLAYEKRLDKVAIYGCVMLSTICCIHLILLVVFFMKSIYSSLLDEAQKCSATVEYLFSVEETDTWIIRVLWTPFISALHHSPYQALWRRCFRSRQGSLQL